MKNFPKSFPHEQKSANSANNQVIHKIIHIIHKDNNVDDLIYINKMKTYVLCKMNKSVKNVKNIFKTIDIFKF